MENRLNFLKTLTVEQFKDTMKVESIKVRSSNKNGTLFFTFGSSVGAVSKNGIPKNPMVSLVCSEDGNPDEDSFWLLHEENNSNVVAEL